MNFNRHTVVTLFFDGRCPLCAKEMGALKRRDRNDQLRLIDIHSSEFVDYPNIDKQSANDILHAITQDGRLLLGLDAVHCAWQTVGMGWLYAPLRWRWIKPIADRGYLWFAKNRYRLSKWLLGRKACDGYCSSRRD